MRSSTPPLRAAQRSESKASMLYLDERDIRAIGVDWHETVQVIEEAVRCLASGDFAQPIKPYLRYRDKRNRIIAMPAFVGGPFDVAGLKWIASFPGNIDRGVPRAHSILVLNDAGTGAPVAIVNTALLSIVRTASVTGLVIRAFDEARPLRAVKLGMTGFGPIGQNHLRMCAALLGDRIERVSIYDVREVAPAVDFMDPAKVTVVKSWQEAYDDADVFITCTVSPAPYIDRRPRPGSLHLNVSLRDYTPAVFDWMKGGIIVDDWEEVCRESTDIEVLHKEKGLQQADTKNLVDVVTGGAVAAVPADRPVMFNPMGMGVFDIATAAYYVKKAREKKVGTDLG
jgi:N-[(2S)-2-amino-2-carboxyethyl]-L-glutamate dehydrogenase